MDLRLVNGGIMFKIFKGRERMIFALLGGILFLFLQVIFPQMKFTEEGTIMFIGLIGAYIVGEGISKQEIGLGFKELFKSQKFQALVVGLIIVVIKGIFPNFSITEEQLMGIVGLFSTFILSAGVRS